MLVCLKWSNQFSLSEEHLILSVSESQLQSLPLNPTRNSHDEQSCCARVCACINVLSAWTAWLISITTGENIVSRSCRDAGGGFFIAGCRKIPRDEAEPWRLWTGNTRTLTAAHWLALFLEYVRSSKLLKGKVWTHTIGPRHSSESLCLEKTCEENIMFMLLVCSSQCTEICPLHLTLCGGDGRGQFAVQSPGGSLGLRACLKGPP